MTVCGARISLPPLDVLASTPAVRSSPVTERRLSSVTLGRGRSRGLGTVFRSSTAHHPALVIGGMHRSGTSLVASLCRSGGLDVGDRLVPPHASNPAGHFEDLSFYEFHERVLAANGRIPAGYDILDAPLAISAPQHAEARSLVATRRQVAGPWGWKDPRTGAVSGLLAGKYP